MQSERRRNRAHDRDGAFQRENEHGEVAHLFMGDTDRSDEADPNGVSGGGGAGRDAEFAKDAGDVVA